MFCVVVFVYLTGVATPDEGGLPKPAAPLYIGLAVPACIAAFPGNVFSPARAFAPTVIKGAFARHGVLWVGPVIGDVLAATVSRCARFIFSGSARDHASDTLTDTLRDTMTECAT